MTVAADTREAVRSNPFLQTALRAGVVNYTAAARFLDDRGAIDGGDQEAIAAALRRYVEDLDPYAPPDRRVSVSMRSGIAAVDGADAADAPDDPLLVVGETRYAVGDGGDLTAVVVTGDVEAPDLAIVLERLRTAEVGVEAAAGGDGTLAVVVARREGANAVRAVEDAL
jgi:hypothetical protein